MSQVLLVVEVELKSVKGEQKISQSLNKYAISWIPIYHLGEVVEKRETDVTEGAK